MPHKRAKRSAREAQRSQEGHDNAPIKTALSKEAIPKGAARVLNAWKVQEEYRRKRKLGESTSGEDGSGKRKRQRVSSEDSGGGGQGKGKGIGTVKKVDMKIQPGESLAHFNRRVEDSLRPLVREAMHTSAAVARKARKEEEQEKAARKAASSGKNKPKNRRGEDSGDEGDENEHGNENENVEEEEEVEKLKRRQKSLSKPTAPSHAPSPSNPSRPTDFTSISTSAPRRLNDIVQAPPELKKLPRGAKPRVPGGGGEGTATKNTLREGVLSMAKKAMLEEERERAIRAYREMKKRSGGVV